MKIKQSTFYAFRIIYRLDEAGSRVVTSREIAEKEDYSAGMVLKLLCAMRKGGLVSAHQGRGQASGGFTLEKEIDEITILEIVRIMEGVDICANLDETLRQKGTQMSLICSRMNEALAELLSRYTVRDLFEFDATARKDQEAPQRLNMGISLCKGGERRCKENEAAVMSVTTDGRLKR